MMKAFPAKAYHFLFHILPFRTYHGVEHLTSTVITLGPGYNLMKGALYEDLLGVSSHELYHAWNVKTIRPIEMYPYDYTQENYSKLGYKNYATSQDLVTASFNPPQGQRSYTENWSLWYDDGKLNARLTYQGQSAYFNFISSCSNAINNQPTSFPQCSGQTIRTPYNPGGSNWVAQTRYVDAKISYWLNHNLQVYFQGRNITRAPAAQTYQPNNTYSDGTPTVEQLSYGGARWEMGFTFRN